MAIFAVCHRYSEDFISWFSGYCLPFEIHVESTATFHFWCHLLVQSMITFCLLTGPLLPPLPPVLYTAARANFSNKSQIMFKTFHSPPISFRIKFKFLTKTAILHVTALSLTSSYITLLLTHPILSSYTSLLAVSQIH